jgi:hypothetical protein
MGLTSLVASMNQELFLVRHGETTWNEQGGSVVAVIHR